MSEQKKKKKMAIHQCNEQLEHHDNASSVLDVLYCDEGKWEEQKGELSDETESDVINKDGDGMDTCVFPLLLLDRDLLWGDEELNCVFYKEQKQQQAYLNNLHKVDVDTPLSVARREAVEWMLKVNAHYGFSSLTATLAITYLDSFLVSFHFQREKPWMIQLVAVTCLSLAAKIEETQVPLLLDLQVEDTKYVFEAKTIQRMELLVLSTLQWKMHPVTPLSFLDHIISRLPLKTHLHWEFLRRCHHLLLSVLLDSRFVGCLPSALATATMLHAIDQIEHSDDWVEYKNQLLRVLKTSKERVEDCFSSILQLSKVNNNNNAVNNPRKRKYEHDQIPDPGSPSDVIDADFSCDSWAVRSSSYSSREPLPLFKKSRTQEQQMKLSPLNNRLIVGIVGTGSSH